MPCNEWINLFRLCHEWRWYGEHEKKIDAKRVKIIPLGYYSRLEWPDGKCLLDQYNVLVEIFVVIKDEQARIDAQRTR